MKEGNSMICFLASRKLIHSQRSITGNNGHIEISAVQVCLTQTHCRVEEEEEEEEGGGGGGGGEF